MPKKIDVSGLDHYHDKVSAMVADEYSSSATYAVGDYCFHAGTLYKCTTAITTAEAWTSGHWTAAKLAEDTSELKTALSDVVTVSNNVFDKTAIRDHAYIGANGILQTSPSYSGWFVSDYIPVLGNKLQANIGLTSIVIYNEDDSVDSANSYGGLNTAATLPFTLPATAKKIRISAKRTNLSSDIMINFGETLLPYTEYGLIKINEDVIAESLKENPVEAKLNSIQTSENYLSGYKQALKKNVLVSYFATFTAFTSLNIGFTTTDTYSTGYLDYIEITETNFILHRKNQNEITWAHSLTIKDYVSIEITFDFSMNFSATLKTNGGSFNKTNYFYLGASYYPFAVLSATNPANNKLSFSCSDFQKRIMMFGDSYFGNASTRWLYYLTDAQRANLCINGYSGEASPNAIINCATLFGLGSPKYAVWCMGMNDGSDTDDSTPSTQWLTNIQTFISYCEKRNIVPVLATIPSVPSINNRAKSAWVRASGYRYIDFAAAVNDGNEGAWFDNMLSSDNVHPDVQGAKALCARAITDLPEILIP